MGEIADMMLDGTLCEGCGVYLGEVGYTQLCAGCAQVTADTTPKKKVRCKKCGKLVKEVGLQQHMEALHHESSGTVEEGK